MFTRPQQAGLMLGKSLSIKNVVSHASGLGNVDMHGID